MTWKERRTITILSAILAVLSAALLIVLGMKYREARAAEDPDAPVPGYVDTQSGEFTSLRYSNGAATLSFVQDANGAWIWADDGAFPLDDTTITTILDTLSAMTPQQTLTAPESLEEYGLDDPDVSLTAGTADGKTFTVAFGKTTTDGKSYYTMLNDDTSTIYIFSGELRRLLDAPIYDMMELPQLPDLDEKNITSVQLELTDGTVRQLTSAVETRETEVETETGETDENGEPIYETTTETEEITLWSLDGQPLPEGAVGLEDWLYDLSTLYLDSCSAFKADQEELSACGMDGASLLTVSLTSGET